MNFTNEQINRALEQLPEEVQDFIMSVETRRLIEDLIAYYEIEDQANFKKIILAYMTGITGVHNLTDALQKTCDVLDEDADDILFIIDGEVMRYIYSMIEDDATETPQSTPTSAPTPGALPTHDEILKAVENPVTKPAPSILDSKLSGTTTVPKEEIKIQKYKDVDPYREPLA